MKLNYYIVNKSDLLRFNLNKDASNISTNQLALNALIGTLVKYGPSGRIEPYIAESWEVSEDKKTWKFKIRDNIFCEDGVKITAELFYQSLLSSFNEYRKKDSAIMFDYLIGWDDFKNQKSAKVEGLKFQNNQLEFHFVHYPDEILELLRMPYFGIWRYDSSNKIISSSAYKIIQNDHNKISLALREDWFSSHRDSILEIDIQIIVDLPSKDNFSSNFIIQIPYEKEFDQYNNQAYWIHFPPTLLDTFVLSPTKDGLFQKVENRKAFLQRVKSLPKSLIQSTDFYPSAPTKRQPEPQKKFHTSSSNETITFILEKSNYSENEVERIKEIISKGLEGSGHNFKIINRDLKDSGMLTETLSNNKYDARISSVNIGAHPIYTAIKMMFCTKLGITFPGHEKLFCEMIEHNLKNGLPMNEQFINNFNQSLESEAIIIPIAHKSQSILVSKRLDPIYLPATNPFPLFEKLRIKDNE